ncbi:hypothetical protein [Streptomyces sp. NPDC047042]|uniref:hypothetical protein n=1 Tax=Streptomyces sp. NPDC047042 TaxID=3154807 RepID=UPI003406DF4A
MRFLFRFVLRLVRRLIRRPAYASYDVQLAPDELADGQLGHAPAVGDGTDDEQSPPEHLVRRGVAGARQ